MKCEPLHIGRDADSVSAIKETMPINQKPSKAPKLFLQTGEEAFAHRTNLQLNQSDFWNRIGVSQSGSSRYESGRKLPKPIQLLLHLTYATTTECQALLDYLRHSPE